jgi:RNA polymerase sigma factor (sigma-70 family)
MTQRRRGAGACAEAGVPNARAAAEYASHLALGGTTRTEAIEIVSGMHLVATTLPSHEAARLESIYRAEIERLRALGTMLTGSPAAGEDLAQDAFIESIRRGVDEPGYLREPAWPWLRVTMVRLALRRRRRLATELQRMFLLTRAHEEVDWTPATDELVRALRRLPPRMRACVTLRYVDDLANRDIAEAIGCSVKTVENQLRIGRARLRLLLASEGFEHMEVAHDHDR